MSYINNEVYERLLAKVFASRARLDDSHRARFRSISRTSPRSAEVAHDEIAIATLLRGQEQAWNRGDVEGLMNGYMHSNGTVFVSAEGLSRAGKPSMIVTAVNTQTGHLLASDVALMLGRWELKRASDHPHGYFALIVRRTPDGWRIVHDHASEAQ